MFKGQSLIIQFILFFLIGFGLFVTMGQVFKIQSEVFRNDIILKNIQLSNSFLSSAVVAMNSCKNCDQVTFFLRVENTTADMPLEFNFDSSGLKIDVVDIINGQIKSSYSSTIHNLASSIAIKSGKGFSQKTITLTLDKTKNELRVG